MGLCFCNERTCDVNNDQPPYKPSSTNWYESYVVLPSSQFSLAGDLQPKVLNIVEKDKECLVSHNYYYSEGKPSDSTEDKGFRPLNYSKAAEGVDFQMLPKRLNSDQASSNFVRHRISQNCFKELEISGERSKRNDADLIRSE